MYRTAQRRRKQKRQKYFARGHIIFSLYFHIITITIIDYLSGTVAFGRRRGVPVTFRRFQIGNFKKENYVAEGEPLLWLAIAIMQCCSITICCRYTRACIIQIPMLPVQFNCNAGLFFFPRNAVFRGLRKIKRSTIFVYHAKIKILCDFSARSGTLLKMFYRISEGFSGTFFFFVKFLYSNQLYYQVLVHDNCYRWFQYTWYKPRLSMLWLIFDSMTISIVSKKRLKSKKYTKISIF